LAPTDVWKEVEGHRSINSGGITGSFKEINEEAVGRAFEAELHRDTSK